MQTHSAGMLDYSFMEYEQDEEAEVPSCYHDLGELERRGQWLRWRCATSQAVSFVTLVRGYQPCCTCYSARSCVPLALQGGPGDGG